MNKPSASLPWGDRHSEVALNDALAWLLQLHPAMAKALSQLAGLPMDARRHIDTKFRKADGGEGFPDLMVDGQNSSGERLRVIVELKLNRTTGFTWHETRGYPSHRRGFAGDRVKMIVVGPVGYDRKWAVPRWAKFFTLSELFSCIKDAAPDVTTEALLESLWTHFRGQVVYQEAIEEMLDEDSSYGPLWRFLRELVNHTAARKNLEPSKIDGSRTWAPYFYGFHIRHRRIRRGDRVIGWAGFSQANDDFPPRFVVNIRQPALLDRAEEITEAAGNGSTYERDDGWAAGAWHADHLPDPLTPTEVMDGGLADLLDLMDAEGRG
jgi:hypothetical protein